MAKGRPTRGTEQLLVRPSSEVVEKLDRAAGLYGYRSRNEVAVEIIETYFEFWEQAQQSRLATIEQQRAGLFAVAEVSRPYMSGRGSRKEIQKVTRDAQSREAKKRRK